MQAITVRPADGGQLMTRVAAEDVGLTNYTLKRNWRRDLTDEVLREGHDYFIPLPGESDATAQPFPFGNQDPVGLIHLVRRPNGDTAVVAGSASSLFRFSPSLLGYMENPPLYADGDSDGPYFVDLLRWQSISTGFDAAAGRRWESVDIDGTTVFNNSVDLPVAFRVEWDVAEPLYELREQGVVCVGTIGQLTDKMLCGDITELRKEDVPAILNVVDSGTFTVSQNGRRESGSIYATSDGSLIRCATDFFIPGDAGRIIVWSNGHRERLGAYVSPTRMDVVSGTVVLDANRMTFWITDDFFDGYPGAPSSQWDAYALRSTGDFFTSEMTGKLIGFRSGQTRKIVKVFSPTLARTDVDKPLAAEKAYAENPKAFLGRDDLGLTAFDRRQYRVLWPNIGSPTRFSTLIPVSGDVGSLIVRTDRTVRSIQPGDYVAVIGGGLNGGTLMTRVVASGPGFFRIAGALRAVPTGIQRADSVGGIAGFDDIQDDGSGILKMLELQGRIIVYKDTNLFIGRYTGNVDKPYEFTLVKVPHNRCLHFRNTLIAFGNTHVYAGQDRFYRFDMTSQMPEPVPALDMIGNLFFDYARIHDTETIYAADNSLTKELWFVNPANTSLPVIALDYEYSTASTVDVSPTALESMEQAWAAGPTANPKWCVMGAGNGVVLFYGLTSESNVQWSGAKSIFYRRGSNPYSTSSATYTATLSSGRINFGKPFDEKEFERYCLLWSSLQGASPEATVTFYTSLNQSADESLLGAQTITDADNHGMIPLHCVAHLIRDEIQVSSAGGAQRIHSRTWNVTGAASLSYNRKG